MANGLEGEDSQEYNESEMLTSFSLRWNRRAKR